MADTTIELCPHVCAACGGCDLCCPGDHAACESCGKPIRFAVVANNAGRKPKLMPLDADPGDGGNVAAWRDETGTLRGRVLGKGQKPAGQLESRPGGPRRGPAPETGRAEPRPATPVPGVPPQNPLNAPRPGETPRSGPGSPQTRTEQRRKGDVTPDRDPDTTQAVPRHTGTGHVPAVDPALAEQRLLGIVDRLLALADEWDAKGAKIWGQIGLLDLDGALAGLKAVGAAAHQAHAQAIREAILGAPATAEGRRA